LHGPLNFKFLDDLSHRKSSVSYKYITGLTSCVLYCQNWEFGFQSSIFASHSWTPSWN